MRPSLRGTAAIGMCFLAMAATACTSDSVDSEYGEECAQFKPDPDNPLFPPERNLVDREILEWPTATPGDVGMDPAVLDQAAEEVSLSPVVASLLVARHGKLVFEQYFNGFDAADANNVHSLAKSILSVLTGIAIDEGHIDLDTRIGDVLPADLVGEHGELTVQNLVTMAGGVGVPEPEWAYEWEPGDGQSFLRAILERPRVAEPGAEFVYSTGLTHALAAVVAEASGMPLCEFAAQHLLGPLGIDAEHWHVDLDGYFAPGPSFLTPREIARFGQLVLDGGSFDGRQLVSQSWLDQSLSSHWELGCIPRPPVMERYGYLWWGYDIGGHEVWIASGAGGQNAAIIKDLDLLVVVTHETGQTEGARVPMPALLHELLIGAVEGHPEPQPDEQCLSTSPRLASVPADGSGVPTAVPDWPWDVAGQFSPDGRELAFAKVYLGFWNLFTVNHDGTDERRITRDSTPDVMPSWSPGGTLLAFTRGEPSQSDLYVISPDGSGLEQLTDLDGYEQVPTWSPDGKKIAFIWGHRDVNGWGHPGELWVIDRDGSNLQQLRQTDTADPMWSPDGRYIAFDSLGTDGHIGLLDLDSGTVTDLGEGFFPRWSPDGARIAFAVLADEGGSDIHTMAADGSDRIQLTSDTAFDTGPQWSPDGTTIKYWTWPSQNN